MKVRIILLFGLLMVSLCWAKKGPGEAPKPILDGLRNYAPKLYLDCIVECDEVYIKDEINFVNFVRERTEADIHLIITTETTASGGQEYNLAFHGQKEFDDLNYGLVFAVQTDATEDEIREQLVKTMRQGLVTFVSRTPLKNFITIGFDEEARTEEVVDKWNNWVFELSLYCNAWGSSNNSYLYYDARAGITRITETQKLQVNTQAQYHEEYHDMPDGEVQSVSRGYNCSIFQAFALSEHFSVGGWLNFNTSEYGNIDYGFSVAPAVEYNIFPYSEYAEHKFALTYRIAPVYNKYIEETIYKKNEETLFQESLELGLESTKRWGSTWLYTKAYHYLHDFSKNRLQINGGVALAIFAGLSLNIDGDYAMIHDQLSLPKGEFTEEERLLRLKELETDYSYNVNFGFSYTFGSIYSNIVNPIF